LPDQPIFYPVLAEAYATEAYATKIARDWNAPRDGGSVTRLQVRRDFMRRHPVQDAGGREHLEYWIPAEDLPACNNAIVGQWLEALAFLRPSNLRVFALNLLFACVRANPGIKARALSGDAGRGGVCAIPSPLIRFGVQPLRSPTLAGSSRPKPVKSGRARRGMGFVFDI